MQIVLASQSPYRKAQLENFGLSFQALRPKVNEDELKEQGPDDLVELTRYLAHQKAMSLRDEFPAALILGSDQMVEFHGKRLDKPGSSKAAKAQLQLLQNDTHRLLTSLTLATADRVLTYTDITSIRMRSLDDALIDAYLNLDQPFDCAGSYKIEKAGLALVAELDSADPSAIQGLPLLSLVKGFEALNLKFNQLWGSKK
jgi:septum formation protein